MSDQSLVALIVDDEPLLRMSTAEQVLSLGYNIIEAGSGDEAVGILNSGLNLGLLITDVRMPGAVDGVALARHARNLFPALPVVIMSGFNSYADAEASLDGTAQYIIKPFSTSELRFAISSAVESNISADCSNIMPPPIAC